MLARCMPACGARVCVQERVLAWLCVCMRAGTHVCTHMHMCMRVRVHARLCVYVFVRVSNANEPFYIKICDH